MVRSLNKDVLEVLTVSNTEPFALRGDGVVELVFRAELAAENWSSLEDLHGIMVGYPSAEIRSSVAVRIPGIE